MDPEKGVAITIGTIITHVVYSTVVYNIETSSLIFILVE